MAHRTLRTRLSRLALLALPLLLSACANLGAIQEFGRLSADSAAFQKINDNHIGSANLRQDLTLRREDGARASIEATGAGQRHVAQQSQLLQRALSDYMAALAQLAGDDVVVVDDQVDSLVDAAAGDNVLEPQRAASVGAIGKLLSEAALNGWRQRQLNQVIERGNAPLQELVGHIGALMTVYAQQIDIDQAAFTSHYDQLDAMARPNEPAAAEILWQQRRQGLRQFDVKRQAIAHYRDTISKIGAAHQALYDNRADVTKQEVVTQLKRYIQRIRAARDAMQAE